MTRDGSRPGEVTSLSPAHRAIRVSMSGGNKCELSAVGGRPGRAEVRDSRARISISSSHSPRLASERAYGEILTLSGSRQRGLPLGHFQLYCEPNH